MAIDAEDGRQSLRAAADGAFERWLLDAARNDAPPDEATAAAWARLSASLGPAQAAPLARAPGVAVRAAPRFALKWMLLGAVAGSALTGSWFLLRPHASEPAIGVSPASAAREVVAPDGSGRAESAASATSAASSRSPARPSGSVAQPATSDRAAQAPSSSPHRMVPSAASLAGNTPTRAAARVARVPGRASHADVRADATRAPATPPARHDPSGAAPAAPSTLEREVRALDTVRAALTDRHSARALELLADYEREFPDGTLAREADLFEIEALLASDRAAAERRADAFLRDHPTDVHAARVRALLQR